MMYSSYARLALCFGVDISNIPRHLWENGFHRWNEHNITILFRTFWFVAAFTTPPPRLPPPSPLPSQLSDRYVPLGKHCDIVIACFNVLRLRRSPAIGKPSEVICVCWDIWKDRGFVLNWTYFIDTVTCRACARDLIVRCVAAIRLPRGIDHSYLSL